MQLGLSIDLGAQQRPASGGGAFQQQLLRIYGAYSSAGASSLLLPTSDTIVGSVGLSAKAQYVGSGSEAVSGMSVARYPDVGASDFCYGPPPYSVIGFTDYDVDTISTPTGCWNAAADGSSYFNIAHDLTQDTPGGFECDMRVITQAAVAAAAPWTGIAPTLAITSGQRAYERTGTIAGTYSLAGTGLTDANISISHTSKTDIEYAQTGMTFSGGNWSCNTNAGVKIVRMTFGGITIAIAIGHPIA